MGSYEMNDNEKEMNQKSNRRLVVEDDGTYKDQRKIMKYYKNPYTLNEFIPRYLFKRLNPMCIKKLYKYFKKNHFNIFFPIFYIL